MTVSATESGVRLDLYLTQRAHDTAAVGELSRAEIQRLIDEGQITVNGRQVKPSTKLKPDDWIAISIPPPRETSLASENLPLEILFEDDDCIVVNKAPGMVVHPAAGQQTGTLVNALLHRCPQIEGIGGERRPGIVHRLDKDTSGVMIVAKNAGAFRELAQQFIDRTVKKEYLAIVWGKLKPERGTIDRPIGRHRSDRKKMSSLRAGARRREALTAWRVEEYLCMRSADGKSFSDLTLVRVIPRTGRTHQIRVHFADLGYPIAGDRVYGGRRNRHHGSDYGPDPFSRQALHAEKLVIRHPATRQIMEFYAPLPQDMENWIAQFRKVRSNDALGVDKENGFTYYNPQRNRFTIS